MNFSLTKEQELHTEVTQDRRATKHRMQGCLPRKQATENVTVATGPVVHECCFYVLLRGCARGALDAPEQSIRMLISIHGSPPPLHSYLCNKGFQRCFKRLNDPLLMEYVQRSEGTSQSDPAVLWHSTEVAGQGPIFHALSTRSPM